jgi:hypothetical protein
MKYQDIVVMYAASFAMAKVVAEKCGMETAKEVVKEWGVQLVSPVFEQKREELGFGKRTDLTVKEAQDVVIFYDKESDIIWDVVEETPDRIVTKIEKCPVKDACAFVGANAEELCGNAFLTMATKMIEVLNPKLKWVGEFEPDLNKPCRYVMSYKE